MPIILLLQAMRPDTKTKTESAVQFETCYESGRIERAAVQCIYQQ